MSVILLGDGTITSSVALTTLTLNNPVASNPPREFIDNLELLRGDGGVIQLYKKGRRSLRSTLRIPWMSKTIMDNLMKILETVDQTNWFTLQDHTVGIKTSIAHETLTLQKILIRNPTAFNDSNWIFMPEGLTAFCLSVVGGGGNTGERRRIDYWSNNEIRVPLGFTNNIQVGDTFLIGIPVIFASPPKIEPLSYNSFRVEINFEEKIF